MEWLLSILGLAFLMVVHESGHYLAARVFGMRVTKFSIGFGPTFFKVQPMDGWWTFTSLADRVKVRALDQSGKAFELEATGLLAIAIQHENDHLDGVLLIDKLNALRRRLVSRKVNRALAEEARS